MCRRAVRPLLVAAAVCVWGTPGWAQTVHRHTAVRAAQPEAAAEPAPVPQPPAPQLAQPQPPPTLGTPAAKDTDPALGTTWTIADRRPHDRTQALSLAIGVWPPTTLSGALYYAIPVAPNGMIPAVNDSLDIEFGLAIAGFFDGPDHGALWPSAGVRWNFHLTHDWTTFATLKLAPRFGLGYSPDWFDMNVGLGALLRLQDRLALRLELGYPTGIMVGLSFLFGG